MIIYLQIVGYCIEKGLYDYLSLFNKYFEKNNKIIKKSLNTECYDPNDDVYDHPLILLFKSKVLSDKWINFYFELCFKCKVIIHKKIENQLFEMIVNNNNLLKYKKILEKKLLELKQNQE